MKNLEITLSVRANNLGHAENIAKRELMELAKVIGKRSGSSMASGSGEATHIAGDAYQINATVSIDGNGNVNNIIKEIQNIWMNKFEIVRSVVCIVDEPKADPVEDMEKCECCGGYFHAADMAVINRDTEEEYWLCAACFDKAEDIICCGSCREYVNQGDLVENPVKHTYNICPCCGETM